MATIPYKQVSAPPGRVQIIVWRGLTAGDVGEPFVGAPATAQMTGTFGGPVTLEGTLMPAESVWGPLLDAEALPIIASIPTIARVSIHSYKTRPRAGAHVQSVDVWLLVPA